MNYRRVSINKRRILEYKTRTLHSRAFQLKPCELVLTYKCDIFYAWSVSLNHLKRVRWKILLENPTTHMLYQFFLTSSPFESKEACLLACLLSVLFQKKVYSEFGHREIARSFFHFLPPLVLPSNQCSTLGLLHNKFCSFLAIQYFYALFSICLTFT